MKKPCEFRLKPHSQVQIQVHVQCTVYTCIRICVYVFVSVQMDDTDNGIACDNNGKIETK